MKSSSPASSPARLFSQSMQLRLQQISLGLKSYLQNHDRDSLEMIKSEGKEATRLLEEFKRENAGSGNGVAPLERAHEQTREATLSLLAGDHAASEAQKGLNESSRALLALLTEQMESAVKPNQLNATGRLRQVRLAIIEAKKFTGTPALDWDPQPSRARFTKAMDAYEELSRTNRSRRLADNARSLLDQCVNDARAVQQAESKKQTALDGYRQNYNDLVKALEANVSRGRSGLRIRSVKQLFSTGLAHSLLGEALLFVGLLLILASQRRTEKRLISPLQNILQCVEAASTGDVSRIPKPGASDEMGQLAQAVGRLITVVGRSENLVYHLAALVESSGEAIISHTLDGTILSWNKGAQRVYGYSAEEMKGRSIAILSPQDEGEDMMRHLRKLQRGERVQPFETLHQARNGRSIPALVRVSAILDSTRQIIGASFCAQELTNAGLPASRVAERNHIA